MAEKRYKKLGGRATRPKNLFITNSLWIGRDHLLQIEHTGYSEDYKRFYFSDIQGFTVRLTNRQRTLGIILGALLVLSAAALISFPDPIARSILGSITGVLLLLLVVNFWKGQTCACFVKTAVQEEILPSLRRLRKARKVLAQVKPFIEQHQGVLTTQEARSRLAGVAPEAAASPDLSTSPPIISSEGGNPSSGT